MLGVLETQTKALKKMTECLLKSILPSRNGCVSVDDSIVTGIGIDPDDIFRHIIVKPSFKLGFTVIPIEKGEQAHAAFYVISIERETNKSLVFFIFFLSYSS